MTPKVTVFIATSLDGFIARPDGDLDWLDKAAATVPQGEDCGYQELMNSVDVLVMGRHSYEKVRSFGEWPYGTTPVIVLSSQPISPDSDMPATVSHSSETPRSLCERLGQEGYRHIYVDGGITIQRFLAEDCVDELTITVIPVLLGSGIPLFGTLDKDIPLRCVSSQQYAWGFVQLRYTVETVENV